jgi:hypothetical protein
MKHIYRFTLTLFVLWLLPKGTLAGEDKPVKPEPLPGAPAVASVSALEQKVHADLNAAFSNLNTANTRSIAKDLMQDLSAIAQTAEIQNARSEARNVFAFLDQGGGGGYQTELSFGSLVTLPVGVKKKVGNVETAIGVHSVRFLADHAEVTMFVKMVFPVENSSAGEKERVLYFGAKGIHFTRTGGLQGPFEAALLGDFILPFENWSIVFKGNNSLLDFSDPLGSGINCSSNLDYCSVRIGCDQFEQATLAAEIVFPSNLLVPFNKNDGSTGSERVKAKTVLQVSQGLDDFIGCLEFDSPFALANFPEYGFEITNAFLDLSDTQNPGGINVSYNGAPLPGIADPTWKGLYLQQLSVLLPQRFREPNQQSGSHQAVALGVNNMIIDRTGFTGEIFYNSSPKELGAEKWSWSLDEVKLRFLSNQFRGGSISGQIGLPITAEGQTRFAYQAVLDAKKEMTFIIESQNNVEFRFVRSRANLSRIRVELNYDLLEDKFLPEASLSGSFSFFAKVKSYSPSEVVPVNSNDQSVAIRGISFTDLRLATVAPKFSIGSLTYSETSSLLGSFPVSLKDISFISSGYGLNSNEPGALVVTVMINLLDKKGSQSQGFSAACKLVIPFKEQEGTFLRYIPSRIKPVGAEITGTIASMRIMGALEYNDDNNVKKEWRGGISAFKIDNATGDVKGQAASYNPEKGGSLNFVFGRNYLQDFRYFMIDGFVVLPGDGVPVVGPIKMKSLGISVSYHMKRLKDNGQSATYMDYVDDKTEKLSIRAMAGLIIGKDNLANGNLIFSLRTTESMGLAQVGLYGKVNVAKSLEDLEPAYKTFAQKIESVADQVKDITNSGMLAQVTSNVGKDVFQISNRPPLGLYAGILLDREAELFYAECRAFVNLGIIRGNKKDGQAGGGEILVDNKNDIWYFRAGTPDAPNEVFVGIFKLGVKFNTYFMAGNELPAALPPRSDIANYFGLTPANYDRTPQEYVQLANGMGIAAGLGMGIRLGFDALLVATTLEIAGGMDFLHKPVMLSCEGPGGAKYYGRGAAYMSIKAEIKRFQLRKPLQRKVVAQTAGYGRLEVGFFDPLYFYGRLETAAKMGKKQPVYKVREFHKGTVCR